MGRWLQSRWIILAAALKRPRVRALLSVFGAIGFWDTFAAQLLPKSIAKELPTVYELVEMTSGLLPWHLWVIIGLVFLFVFVLEFAVRQNRRAGGADAVTVMQKGVAAIPYEEWSRLSAIDLETAAAIWAGTREANDVVRHLRFRELKQAVREGRLIAKSKVGGRVNRDTQVTPPELERFFRAFSPALAEFSANVVPFPNMKLAELVRNHLGIDDFLTPDPAGKIGRLLHKIREAALNKQIQIWGRKGCEEGMEAFDIIPRESIPSEYWRSCKINEFDFVTRNGWASTTPDGNEYCEYYGDLQILKQQVETLWPAANMKKHAALSG